ncbi:MAG: hypothetical protein ACP5Q5_09760 [Brevinematia bacterium]
MKKIFFIFFIIIFSCSYNAKNVSENKEDFQISIGPFFLPENTFFSSISINYLTRNPLSTKVFFTMAGEIDWVREEKTPKLFHKMVFTDLEENTFYKFKYKEENEQKEGIIKTLPYGTEYEFNFCISTLDLELKNSTDSAFIVLLSRKNKMNLIEFGEFYKKNEKNLSSNIIVPIFDLFYNEENIYKTKEDGINYFYYKDIAIIGINKKLNNYDKISYYIPEDSKVYILIGDIGKKEVELIARRYSLYVEKIYVYKDSYVELDKVFSLDNPVKINVVKNSRYAMVLKEVF